MKKKFIFIFLLIFLAQAGMVFSDKVDFTPANLPGKSLYDVKISSVPFEGTLTYRLVKLDRPVTLKSQGGKVNEPYKKNQLVVMGYDNSGYYVIDYPDLVFHSSDTGKFVDSIKKLTGSGAFKLVSLPYEVTDMEGSVLSSGKTKDLQKSPKQNELKLALIKNQNQQLLNNRPEGVVPTKVTSKNCCNNPPCT